MKELRDLYDENKKITGEKIYKGENIPPNRYILVVTLFIKNSNNQLLLQKRSKQKGGKYGFISGHPKSGETSLQAVIIEAKEEMNIDIKNEKVQVFHTEKSKNAFYDFYYLEKDIDIHKLTLQNEEVQEAKWMTIEEIEQLINVGGFFENHIEAVEIIKEFIWKSKKTIAK